MDAAFELFADKGYRMTTMEEIARKAGASTKTIYSRYADKAEIMQAVVRRLVERTVAASAAEKETDVTRAEPRAFLIALISRIATVITEQGAGLHRLAFSEGHHFPELAQLHNEAFGRGTGIVRRALEQWRDAGVLTPPGDPKIIAPLFFSMATDRVRIRTVFATPMTSAETDAHVTAAVDLFLESCGYGPKPTPMSKASRR